MNQLHNDLRLHKYLYGQCLSRVSGQFEHRVASFKSVSRPRRARTRTLQGVTVIAEKRKYEDGSDTEKPKELYHLKIQVWKKHPKNAWVNFGWNPSEMILASLLDHKTSKLSVHTPLRCRYAEYAEIPLISFINVTCLCEIPERLISMRRWINLLDAFAVCRCL